MHKMKQIDYETANELLFYEADTGKFYWKPRSIKWFYKGCVARTCSVWNTRFAGKEAFNNKRSDGYCQGKLLNERYKSHRMAWLLHYGRNPSGYLDHINGDRSDNRICNLREATDIGNNGRNAKISKNNSTGYCGVTKHWNKFIARIGMNYERIFLGSFNTPEEANDAYQEAKKQYGYSERHGQ